MDVQAYLNRIGFTGAVTLSTDTLIDLARLHMYHVPFENLDIHYQQRIDLKMASLYQKIVVRKRGGFCYELNGLFCELLVQLGFNAHMVSARVFTKAKKYSPEFDHMAIWLVLNDISYLVDVGFGDFIIEPLQIIPALIQSNSSGEFVIDA
ncbi:acetyltransferase, partial [Nonlabens dokdonensis]